MNEQTTRLPKFFFRTTPQPCPYLPGRTERNIFAEIVGPDGQRAYDLLAHHGFRRSHRIVYRPDCIGCSACTPVRVVVDAYTPSRSQQRVLRRNMDLSAHEIRARSTIEQYLLFGRYLSARHADGEMAAMSYEDFRGMIEDTPVESGLTEFRTPDGALAGVCLFDGLADGISAVYSFFDPELADRSLGTFMVMWVIERARSAGLPYAYLGYWIEASQKMAYKARFRPLEALSANGWRQIESAKT